MEDDPLFETENMKWMKKAAEYKEKEIDAQDPEKKAKYHKKVLECTQKARDALL